MKLGFIGTGNMAGAIMGGIIGQGLIPASEIIGQGFETINLTSTIHDDEDIED